MINKISFTGREEMLNKGIKTGVKQIEKWEYTNPAKVYSPEELEAALKKLDKATFPKYERAEAAYTSPYAPIAEKSAADAEFVSDSMPTDAKIDFKA